jgi:defect-in-organelle-trafficking protein DotB
MSQSEFFLHDAPTALNEDALNRIFIHAADVGAADIKIQTEEPVILKVHGRVHKITPRPLSPQEVELAVTVLYGSEGLNILKSGRDIDIAYDIRPTRTTRYRFRVNMVSGVVFGQPGIDITCRIIKLMPPSLADNNVEEGIIKALFPQNGIVLVVGQTASGKSTLIASTLREIAEGEDSNKFICTFEDPIEYVFDGVRKPTSNIFQTAIGADGQLRTFLAAIRNGMRRAPDILFMGETRDVETSDATASAAQSGHTVYSTLHADSVSNAVMRWVNFFPESSRAAALGNLLASIRLIVWQKLCINPKGGRVPVREYLQFTGDIRRELLQQSLVSPSQVILRIDEMIREVGQTKKQSAQRYLDRGEITEETFLSLI